MRKGKHTDAPAVGDNSQPLTIKARPRQNILDHGSRSLIEHTFTDYLISQSEETVRFLLVDMRAMQLSMGKIEGNPLNMHNYRATMMRPLDQCIRPEGCKMSNL